MIYSAAFYKNKIASRYIPVDPEQIGIKIAEADYYLNSIKYNGHFAMLEIAKDKIRLFNGSGKEISARPLEKAASEIGKEMLLAGELVVFRDEQPLTHMELTAALDEPDKHDIRFAVFDVISFEGQPAHSDVKERFDWLSKNIPGGVIFPAEQSFTNSRKDIIQYYKDQSINHEGIIVRASNGVIYKIKPSITLDLVVLGYAEDPNAITPRLRELLLGFVTASGDYQIVTRCGNGFSEKERADWISMLEPLKTDSDHTEISGAKTAFIMVRPEVVVEIKCLDLINVNTSGPIRKSLLRFDQDSGYHSQGGRNTLSCISPHFIRIRTDKQPNQEEAGESQAVAYIEAFSETSIEGTLEASTIVAREVYKKEGKGGMAVRKFVILQTHKEKSGLYSPYVMVFTDFSASRKTPMEQELYLFEDKGQAMQKLKELKEENIKKGWEQHH